MHTLQIRSGNVKLPDRFISHGQASMPSVLTGMEQVIQTIAWVLSPMSVKRISSASFSKKKWAKTDWSGLRLRLKYGTVRLLLFRPGFPANACICASGLLVLVANRCCYLGNSIHSLADVSGGVADTFDALANAIVLQAKGMDALADALIAL